MCFANPDLIADYDNEESVADTLYQLKEDPNLFDYLNASVGAINRCLTYFEIKGLSPVGLISVKLSSLESKDGLLRLDVNELVPNLLRIRRILSRSRQGNSQILCCGESDSNELLIEPPIQGDELIIEYNTRIPKITHSTPDSYDVMLPNHLCALIPYFVKGDILRVDDPDEAKEAMKEFKELVSLADTRYDASPPKADPIYRMG